MPQILTVRIKPALLAKAASRAAQLGLDRGKYVRDLIERDLRQDKSARKRRFASEAFVGSATLGLGPYTNDRVREAVRTRLRAKREKNR
jgi:hypothetical protein